MLLIGVLGPPVASLILLMSHYLPSCAGRTEPVDLPCFVVTYVFFAVPVGYVFGLVPALLAAVMYCGALTAMTKLRTQRLLRVWTGTLSGGLAGGARSHHAGNCERRVSSAGFHVHLTQRLILDMMTNHGQAAPQATPTLVTPGRGRGPGVPVPRAVRA